jgi:hypothetical protein
LEAVIILAIAAALCGPNLALAAPFQNLGFEMAKVGSASPGSLLSVGDALPYWTCNNFSPGTVLYDSTTLDAYSISLHDGKGGSFFDFKPLTGRYSVMLQDGFADVGYTSIGAYISQVGDVPSDARSIMFSSDCFYTFDRFEVSLNGTPIPMQLYAVENTVNPSFGPIETFIGDISAYAGVTDVELRFTKLVQDPSSPGSHGRIDFDSIEFSPTIVPEPSTLALLTVAALASSACVFRRRRGGGHLQ